MSYESPLELIINEMALEMSEKFDSEVLTAIKKYHIDVNKDELIKALQYDRGQYEKGYQDGLKSNGWISVKDRLPETGRLALVYGSAGAMTIGRYIANNEWLVPGIFSTVTHWMPLPEPPEEVSGEWTRENSGLT